MCGDTIELTLQLNQAGNRIEDVKFEGEGCAIAIAFTEMTSSFGSIQLRFFNQAVLGETSWT